MNQDYAGQLFKPRKICHIQPVVCQCATSSIRVARISGFKDKTRQTVTQPDIIVQPVQKWKRQLQKVVNFTLLERVKHRLNNLPMGLLQIRLNHRIDTILKGPFQPQVSGGLKLSGPL